MINLNTTTPAIGTTAKAEMTVQACDTAPLLAAVEGMAQQPVLTTARMVALMEAAAARVLQPQLSQDQFSVGVAVNVQHTAATAAGQQVYAIACLQRCEGGLLYFRVEAFDGAGSIGIGEHTRTIVLRKRLLASALRRAR